MMLATSAEARKITHSQYTHSRVAMTPMKEP